MFVRLPSASASRILASGVHTDGSHQVVALAQSQVNYAEQQLLKTGKSRQREFEPRPACHSGAQVTSQLLPWEIKFPPPDQVPNFVEGAA